MLTQLDKDLDMLAYIPERDNQSTDIIQEDQSITENKYDEEIQAEENGEDIENDEDQNFDDVEIISQSEIGSENGSEISIEN